LGAKFRGKVAIVTGPAGGINRVILTRLAEEGASINCLPDGLDNYESIAKQPPPLHRPRCVGDGDHPVAERWLDRTYTEPRS
jgi:NAD(P)-dependent dehydrogenase (short-subunit alcohol dehydrogenase family)